VRSGGRTVGSLGDAAGDTAAAGMAEGRMGSDLIGVEPIGEGRSIFLESIDVVPRLVLFGGGHVSREVARVAKGAGFRVVVVDDRPAFANPERHPEADETLVMPFEGAVARLGVDRWTYLVAVTRGHAHDEVVIREAAGSPAAYIGMIGSRRKVALMRKKLEAEGVDTGELDRLSAPIGLDIGADAPGEIAVSIVAELIAVRRKGGASQRLSLSRRGPRRLPSFEAD
jgi:xanthine dehydrogenase accessory factor